MSIDPAIVENVAKDYSKYLKIDLAKEGTVVEQIIEDTLTRLEEFQSVMEMVRQEGGQAEIDFIQSRTAELRSMGESVGVLEKFVALVRRDLTAVEAALDRAEAEMGSGTRIPFGKLLKPLFFKKPDEASSSSPSGSHVLPFEPPVIFKTSDYFPEGATKPGSSETQNKDVPVPENKEL